MCWDGGITWRSKDNLQETPSTMWVLVVDFGSIGVADSKYLHWLSHLDSPVPRVLEGRAHQLWHLPRKSAELHCTAALPWGWPRSHLMDPDLFVHVTVLGEPQSARSVGTPQQGCTIDPFFFFFINREPLFFRTRFGKQTRRAELWA